MITTEIRPMTEAPPEAQPSIGISSEEGDELTPEQKMILDGEYSFPLKYPCADAYQVHVGDLLSAVGQVLASGRRWVGNRPVPVVLTKVAMDLLKYSNLSEHEPYFQDLLRQTMDSSPDLPTAAPVTPGVSELLTDPETKQRYLARMCLGENFLDLWKPIGPRETAWWTEQAKWLADYHLALENSESWPQLVEVGIQ